MFRQPRGWRTSGWGGFSCSWRFWVEGVCWSAQRSAAGLAPVRCAGRITARRPGEIKKRRADGLRFFTCRVPRECRQAGILNLGPEWLLSSRIRHAQRGARTTAVSTVRNRCQSALVQGIYGLNKHRREHWSGYAGQQLPVRYPVVAGAPARHPAALPCHRFYASFRKYQLPRRTLFVSHLRLPKGARARCSARP